jgi:hypothetical protein
MLEFAVLLFSINMQVATLAESTAFVDSPILIARSTSAAVIDKFEVKAVTVLDPGTKLVFMLQGTPKSDVNLTLPVSQGKNVVHMKEAKPGKYTATYTIRKSDKFLQTPGNTYVNAQLQNGTRSTVSSVQLDGSPAPHIGVKKAPIK